MERDEHWAQVWELFNSAYEKPPGQRSALLHSGDLDPEVRSEVLALLEVSASCTTGRPMSAPPVVGPEYPVGHQLGRYLILGLIGEGGFGRIYAAHDRDLRRVVALKVLAGPISGQRERLIEEACAATALNHPNIVTVYETVSADDHLAIVMEFVDGSSLRSVLRDSVAPLPLEKVIRYGRQIAEALRAAHQAGITHRDVKPENILVRKDEYLKLVDFGLATHVAASLDSGAGLLAGTLRYISPEQLRGEPASPAADVFSFGLVLYEMLTGVHAFQGETPLDTADAIVTVQPLPPSAKARGVPAAFDRLVLAMLAKDPDSRPSIAEIVCVLKQIGEESSRRSHRRKWIAGAMVAIVGGAAGTALWPRKSTPIALRFQTRPLTGERGRETVPALSPDGRFVAYIWQATAIAPPVTLVREIDSDRSTVLPIRGRFGWLPDNWRIGFVRRGKDRDGLYTIGRDGTGEHEILQARDLGYAQWSPDGNWIVYTAKPEQGGESQSLFLYSTRTREKTQLTFPPDATQSDERFVISPDGKYVAFRRTFDHLSSDIFLIGLPVPGVPRRITSQRVTGDDLAWVADGKAIVSSTISGSTFSLWLHPLIAGQEPTRLTEVGIEVTGVQSATTRRRLAWVSALDDSNIWSVPLNGGTPRRVISSAMRDLDIASSRQGLLAFRSDRSGRAEIWISTEDGEHQTKVTSLNGLSGSPRWSPDGRRLVFDSRRGSQGGIFSMDCEPKEFKCAAPVQLTDHPGIDAIPNWSADGKSVYFGSRRTGQWQIWKIDVDAKGREPVPVTAKGGLFATESTDGRWLYYSRTDSEAVMGVWRKPLPGNSSAPFRADDAGQMLLPLEPRALATWVLAGQEIIYSTFGQNGKPAALWAFDLATGKKRMIHSAGDAPLARGIALSPDGTSVLFAQLDRWESNIVIADYEIVR